MSYSTTTTSTWKENKSTCPACGKKGYCATTDDGAILCQRTDSPPPGWKVIKRGTGINGVGTVMVEDDGRGRNDDGYTPCRPTLKIKQGGGSSPSVLVVPPKPVRWHAIPEKPSELFRMQRRFFDEVASPEYEEWVEADGWVFGKFEKTCQFEAPRRKLTYQYTEDKVIVRYEVRNPNHVKGWEKTFLSKHRRADGIWEFKKGPDIWPFYRENVARWHQQAFLVEGEKCADALTDSGYIAASPPGAGWTKAALVDRIRSMQEQQGRIRKGLTLLWCYIPDGDKEGKKKTSLVEAACAEVGVSLLVLDIYALGGNEVWDVANIIQSTSAAEFERRLDAEIHAAYDRQAETIRQWERQFADYDFDGGNGGGKGGNGGGGNGGNGGDGGDGPGENGKKGKVTPIYDVEALKILSKIKFIEQQMAGRFSFNRLTGQIFFDGEVLDPNLTRYDLLLAFETKQLIDEGRAQSVVMRMARQNTFHPIEDYLNKCYEEHGANYSLENIAERWFGSSNPLHTTYIVKSLIAMVARVYKPGTKVDTVPILVGRQGCFKSTFFSVLAGDWFTDSVDDLIGMGSRDALAALNHHWVGEIAEIDKLLKKEGLTVASALKAMISRSTDEYRLPYAKASQAHPRQFCLVGTSNDEGLLRDEENRRFFIIPVAKGHLIPIAEIEENRDAIWGAIVSLYKNGVKHYLSHEESLQQALLNKQYEEEDSLWTDLISEWIATHPVDFVATSGIVGDILGLDPQTVKTFHYTKVRSIMLKLGWVAGRRSINGRNKQGYWSPDSTEAQSQTEVQVVQPVQVAEPVQAPVQVVPVIEPAYGNQIVQPQQTVTVAPVMAEPVQVEPAQPVQQSAPQIPAGLPCDYAPVSLPGYWVVATGSQRNRAGFVVETYQVGDGPNDWDVVVNVEGQLQTFPLVGLEFGIPPHRR